MKKYIILFFILGCAQSVKSQNFSLNSIANQYLEEYGIPGIAISVVLADTVYYGVAGVKKSDKSEKIDLKTKFQIASNAKAISATIAAMIVEEGKINWNSTITEVIPEIKGKIRSDYYEVTLEDLLSNRGKVQPFEDDSSKEWKDIPSNIHGSSNSKLEFAKYALNLEPKVSSNKNHSYSNGGFIIAALMLEQSTGKVWEDLIEAFNNKYGVEIFLGFPNQELITGNYGHKKKFAKYKPVGPEDEYKFPFDFSPAGNLSINISDLTKIIGKHLDGLIGKDNLLKSETYTKLHYGLEEYSLGWYNGNIGKTNQKFSYHGGSLGTYSSAIMLSADREIAIIILINSDDKKTNDLKNKLRIQLWEKYGSAQSTIRQ